MRLVSDRVGKPGTCQAGTWNRSASLHSPPRPLEWFNKHDIHISLHFDSHPPQRQHTETKSMRYTGSRTCPCKHIQFAVLGRKYGHGNYVHSLIPRVASSPGWQDLSISSNTSLHCYALLYNVQPPIVCKSSHRIMFTSFSTKNPSKSHSQPATFKRQRRVSVACTNCRSRKIRVRVLYFIRRVRLANFICSSAYKAMKTQKSEARLERNHVSDVLNASWHASTYLLDPNRSLIQKMRLQVVTPRSHP